MKAARPATPDATPPPPPLALPRRAQVELPGLDTPAVGAHLDLAKGRTLEQLEEADQAVGGSAALLMKLALEMCSVAPLVPVQY